MTQQPSSIVVDGVRIALHRKGGGQPVLFLHGANGVPAWLPFFESLATEYELLVPEHPGFGRSDEPDWLRGVPDLAMFYLEFLEALGLREVHLVGNSLGG